MKKTEKLIIDITFDLLYKNGYSSTGLIEILKRANMTKGAMYYHFQSKHDLVLSTIKHNLEITLNDHWVTPFDNTEKPIETLVSQIVAYKDMFEDPKAFLDVKHGCPLSNFAMDMSDTDEELFEYLKSVYERFELSLEKAFTKAQTLKQTKTDFNAKEQALFIISSLEGSIGTAKAYNDINRLKSNIALLVTYIRGL